MRLSSRRAGLSLIEVLVSMAIFLMALTALVRVPSPALARPVATASPGAAQGQPPARAAVLCRSELAEPAAGAVPLQGQSEAAFDDDPEDRWSLECEQGVTQGLWNVTVRVK